MRLSEPTIEPIRTNRRVASLPPGNIFDYIDEKVNQFLYIQDDKSVDYLSSCPCENHLAKTYADRLFAFSVDTLFELLFSDNSFTRHFHNAQKLTGKSRQMRSSSNRYLFFYRF